MAERLDWKISKRGNRYINFGDINLVVYCSDTDGWTYRVSYDGAKSFKGTSYHWLEAQATGLEILNRRGPPEELARVVDEVRKD